MVYFIMMTTKVEISHRTIIFTVVFLAAIWLVLQIRDILFLLFISFILMSALRPIVDWLQSYRIPRILAILLLYSIIFAIFGVAIAGLIPSFSTQSIRLFSSIPEFLKRIFPIIPIDTNALLDQLAPVGENIVKVTIGFFSNIITVLTVMTFTFYFLLERRNLKEFLSGFLGDGLGEKIFSILLRVEQRLSAWVLGELVLMLFIGIIVYVGLILLKVEFALPLAIIAGLLEIVPTIGPILSALPAILVAFATIPISAVWVTALYVVVQQIENNFLVPVVMRKSVGLQPILTIIALMIGAKFAGGIGAVLAVPILITIQEIIASLPNTFTSNTLRTS